MSEEFVVSGDTHIIEPTDLFKTRLPKNLRDRALWEEEFTLDEPLVPGGHTEFKKLHTAGFDGWTVSKYRQFPGPTPDGDPEHILRDMDIDGVDASVMFPNLSLFVLFTDDHELSMAHARVYNDYVVERYLPYRDRMRPTAAIPLTNIDDAVAEVPPDEGTLVAFRNAPNGWHGHGQFVGPRRVIQLNWVTDMGVVKREQTRHLISAFFKRLRGRKAASERM